MSGSADSNKETEEYSDTEEEEDDFRAKCISCNACFRPILTGRGFRCPKFGADRKES